jgi:surface glycoprotein (TIGR04207 family)/PGF-CTERM protein
MTGNSTYRETGRAVFLAAIMVLSMVAMSASFAGAAAAQESYIDSVNRDVSQTSSVDPGSTVTVSFDVQLNQDVDTITISDSVSPEPAAINPDFGATVAGNQVNNFGSGSTGVFNVPDTDVSGETLEWSYDIEVPSSGNAADSYDITGDVVVTEGDGNSENANLGQDTINVNTGDDGGDGPPDDGDSQFEITDVQPKDNTVEPETEFTVEAQVTNNGNSGEFIDINFDSNDLGLDLTKEDVGIQAGSTTTVEFGPVTAPTDEGDYDWTISTPDDSETYTLTVDEDPLPEIGNVAIPNANERTIVNNESKHKINADFAADGAIQNLNQSFATQELLVEFTLPQGFAQDQDSTELAIDVSDMTDAGVAVVDSNGGALGADDITGISGITDSDVQVSQDTGEILVELDPEANVGFNSVTIDMGYQGYGPAGLSWQSQFTTDDDTGDIVVEIGQRATDNTNFRFVQRGATGIHYDDGGIVEEQTTVPSVDPVIGGSSQGAYQVWHGQELTFQVEDIQNTVEIYEYEVSERDNADNVISVGDNVASLGTSPGKLVNLDTGEELEPNERYLVEFPESSNDDYALLNVDPLDFDTAFDAEENISENERLNLEITSEDNTGSGVVAQWLNTDDIPTSLALQRDGTLNGDGEATFTTRPEVDLDGEATYVGVGYHLPSEVSASTDGLEVTEAERADVEIVSPTTEDRFHRGDIIEVSAELSNTETATITFGDRLEGQSVEVNVTVRDVNEDGMVNFVINTFQLGDSDWGDVNVATRDHGIYAPDTGTGIQEVDAHIIDNQELRIGGGSQGQDVLAAATYDIVASPGDTAWKEDDALVSDRSVARVDERGTGNVQVWTAPGTGDAQIEPEFVSETERSDGQSIAEYVEEGRLTTADGTIADNDYFVLQIESTGLEGVLHTAAQLNPDVGQFDFLNRQGDHEVTEEWFSTNLVVEQLVNVDAADSLAPTVFSAFGVQADAGPNLDEYVFNMEAEITDDDFAEVVAGTDEFGNLNEYYLPMKLESGEDGTQVFPTTRTLEPGEELFGSFSVTPPVDGEYFARGGNINPPFANIEIDTSGETAESNELVYSVSTNENTLQPFTFVDDRALVIDDRGNTLNLDDQLNVPQDGNVTVSGRTNIAAGTPLQVNFVTVPGTDDPFFKDNTVVVEYVEGDMNRWSVTADFGDVATGTEFDVNIRRGGDAPLLNPQGEPTSGVVTAAPAVNEFTFSDQRSGGSSVLVETFNATQGGFIAIENQDGDILGLSDRLSVGENSRVAISLDADVEENQELVAVAHRDPNPDSGFYTDDAGERITRTASVQVEAEAEARFAVSGLDPQNAQLEEPGATIEVSATVTNEGDAEGTVEAAFTLDGSTVTTQSVTLAGGESQTVTFEVDTSDLSFGTTYVHGIEAGGASASGALTIAPEPTPTPTPTPEPTATPTPTPEDTPTATPDESSDDDGAGFGAVIALLAFLGAALLAVRREVRE